MIYRHGSDIVSLLSGLAPEIVHFWTEENKDLESKTRDWYIKGGK